MFKFDSTCGEIVVMASDVNKVNNDKGDGEKVNRTGARYKSQAKHDKYGKFEKTVQRKDKALECEICDAWFHTECESVSVPDQVCKFMVEEEAGEQLHWNCRFCKKECNKLFKYMKKKKMK